MKAAEQLRVHEHVMERNTTIRFTYINENEVLRKTKQSK